VKRAKPVFDGGPRARRDRISPTETRIRLRRHRIDNGTRRDRRRESGWPVDLQATVESGQSYLWNRADGRTYEDLHAYGGDAWYETVVDPIPGVVDERALIRVRQEGGVRDGTLHWESSVDAVPLLEHLFRLDDDLDAILDATPDLPLLKRAYDAYEGMRLTRDPVFPCLISFICSAHRCVARIHGMQRRLRETYGDAVTVDGEEYRAFPTPDQLASRTESELRDLRSGTALPTCNGPQR